MTDTKGNGIMNTIFDGYAPYKGDIQYRKNGSLIAFESRRGSSPTVFSMPRSAEHYLSRSGENVSMPEW